MHDEAVKSIEQDISLDKQIFKPQSWLMKIDYISHLILFNKTSIIPILAEQKAGKTTFIKLLIEKVDAKISPYVFNATSSFSEVDLSDFLKTKLLAEADSEEFSLANLISHINERKQHTLLIIDDAQFLPDTFLQHVQQIFNQQKDSHYFHLCLVSDFSLLTYLNKLEANSLNTLEPGFLTESEVKSYLLSTLPSLKRLDQTMSEKRLEQFYRLTGGNIARINDQMINYFCTEPSKPLVNKRRSITNIIFIAAAVCALAISPYIWHSRFLPSSIDEQILPNEIAEIQQPLPSLMPTVPAVEAENSKLLTSQLPNIKQELANQPSQIPTWYIAATIQQVQPSPKRVSNLALEDELDDSLVVRDRVVVIPKILPLDFTKKKPQLAVKKIKLPSPKPKKNKQNKLAQSKQNFTIQLLASRNEKGIKRFIQNHQIKLQTKIRVTKRGGKNWYVLTLGEYAQKKQAQKVAKNLPSNLAHLKPWIRSLTQYKTIA